MMVKKWVFYMMATLLLTGCSTKLTTGSKPINNQNKIQMTLTDHTPSGINDPSLADKVQTYDVVLPVYAKAKKSSRFNAIKNIPAIAPLYTATKKFIVPENKDTVMNWYKKMFKENGFNSSMSGHNSDGFDFITMKNKKGIAVDLGFKKVSETQTFVSYYVKYVPSIKRPSSSVIQGKVNKIIVIRNRAKKIIASKTITDPEKIKTYVNAMNNLQVAHPGRRGCAMDNGTRYVLNFYVSGKDEKAVLNPACGDLLFENTHFQQSQAFFNLLKQTFINIILVDQHVLKKDKADEVNRIFQKIEWKKGQTYPNNRPTYDVQYRGIVYTVAFQSDHKTAFIASKKGIVIVKGAQAETLYKIFSQVK